MILNIYEALEKYSDKLRDYIVKNDNPITMVGLFVGILFIFLIGYNFIHKND